MSPIKNTSGNRSRLKRILFVLFVVTVSLSVMSAVAYASISKNPFPPEPGNETPYMTLNDDAGQKSLFGWNEKPFIYTLLPEINSYNALNMTNTWTFGGKVVASITDTYSDITFLENWKGLDNWTDVGIRQAGEWNVETVWGYAGSKYTAIANNSFTVTPEPFSATLFLIGGIALSTRRFFKKKK